MRKIFNKALIAMGYLLAIGGGISALYYAHSWWSQRNVSAREDKVGLPPLKMEFGSGKTVKFKSRLEPGKEFARIHIDKLGVHLPILEGPNISGMDIEEKNKVESVPLKKGAMHIKDAPLPGESGNSVLAAHNNTALKGFTNLKNIKKGDKIKIDYARVTFIYVVTREGWYVDEDDTSVIGFKTDEPVLRLATCYPFDSRGDAPQRYIVEAKLVERVKN